MIVPEVEAAIGAVRNHFADHPVDVVPDGAGGAHVIIDGVEVGAAYDPTTTWLGFHLNAAYPASDIYPLYVGVLTRVDGQAHGTAIQHVSWQQRPALQLSRKSKDWRPGVDNAVLKAEKVIAWLAAA